MSFTFDLKNAKGKTFVAVGDGSSFALADGRALQYVHVEDTFRIAETGEVLMRPLPFGPYRASRGGGASVNHL